MTPDPYDHMREAFHIVADGLMSWEDPPSVPERRSPATRAVYLERDIATLETAAESLSRAGDISGAVSLWAIVLRIRQAVTDGR